MLFTVKMKEKREGSRHLLLFVFAHGPRVAEARWGPLPRQGEGQKGRKRLGQQPSHVTSGLARYNEEVA
jgi:hypothetical protein